jgi:hypothetical protein
MLEEPGAVAASEASGTVYVLGIRTNSVQRFDPSTGTEVGRALLPDRSGSFGISPRTPGDFQALRPRMGINEEDETVFVTQPESGTLSVVPPDLFPALAGEIPGRDLAAAPDVMAAVPTLIRPAAGNTRADASAPSPPAEAVAASQATPAGQAPATVGGPTSIAGQALAAVPATDPPPGGSPHARAASAEPAPPPEPAPTAVAVASSEVKIEAGLPDVVRANGERGRPVEWTTGDGRFYTQANGAPMGLSEKGFALTDRGGVGLWQGYQSLGGSDRLGYPISQRFIWNDRIVQLTQKALLEWSPEGTTVAVGNVLDYLHDAGDDDRLTAERLIPRQMSYASETGLTGDQVKVRRLALLEADPAIAARYYASPDPLTEFGLPTSRVVDLGPVIAIRTQRGALQRWKAPQAWARAGDVTVVFAGDIARDFGLFGSTKSYPFVPSNDAPSDLGPRVAALRREES